MTGLTGERFPSGRMLPMSAFSFDHVISQIDQ